LIDDAGGDLVTWADGVDWSVPHADKPLPLTAEQTVRLADLENRHKLVLEYEQQKERLYAKLGLPGIERRKDKALRELCRIEKQILKLPAQTPGDTLIKLDLYTRDRDDFGEINPAAESIARDLRRMLKRQTAAA
jgi:hypothetical protein